MALKIKCYDIRVRTVKGGGGDFITPPEILHGGNCLHNFKKMPMLSYCKHILKCTYTVHIGCVY